MSATNRAAIINKLFKVAKKAYPPILPISNRGLLGNMLYACCLENSSNEAADEAFARLEQQYFDWNEVRVTTVSEMAESLKGLYDPVEAANSIKKVLHGVFENYYKFDLEFLKKENLRKTIQQLEKLKGVSPFVVSYTAQVALGGHAIPLDLAMLQLLKVLGIATEKEADAGKIAGLVRVISKSKGIEFFSVVHQLAANFLKMPFSKEIRETLVSIAPDSRDRFPKRGGKIPKTEGPVLSATEAATTEVPGEARKRGPKRPRKPAVVRKSTKKPAAAAPKKKTASRPTRRKSPKTASSAKARQRTPQRPSKKMDAKRLVRKKPR
jgi:endonuclease-3